MPSSHRKSFDEVVSLVEACFGRHKAALIIESATAETGLGPRQDYSYEEVDQILVHLGQAPGLIGISARFARTRLQTIWGDLG